MSLINDALKRAREAEQQSPPPQPAGPRLQPVELPRPAGRGLGLTLPLALAGLALLGLFVVWQLAQNRRLQNTLASKPAPQTEQRTLFAASTAPAAGDEVRSLSSPTPHQQEIMEERKSLPASASPNADSHGAQPPPVVEESSRPLLSKSEAASSPSPATPAGSNNITAASAQTDTVAVKVQELPATNAPAAIEPPKPPALRLQAIAYSATRPSIMINGVTLFLGDPIGEYRVTAITRVSATLSSAGKTKLLSLSD